MRGRGLRRRSRLRARGGDAAARSASSILSPARIAGGTGERLCSFGRSNSANSDASASTAPETTTSSQKSHHVPSEAPSRGAKGESSPVPPVLFPEESTVAGSRVGSTPRSMTLVTTANNGSSAAVGGGKPPPTPGVAASAATGSPTSPSPATRCGTRGVARFSRRSASAASVSPRWRRPRRARARRTATPPRGTPRTRRCPSRRTRGTRRAPPPTSEPNRSSPPPRARTEPPGERARRETRRTPRRASTLSSPEPSRYSRGATRGPPPPAKLEGFSFAPPSWREDDSLAAAAAAPASASATVVSRCACANASGFRRATATATRVNRGFAASACSGTSLAYVFC